MKSKNLNWLVPVLALVTVSSCATLSGAENKENLAKLKYGMSESQVLNLLGSPDSVSRPNAIDDRWIYEYKSQDKKGHNLFVDFKSGQVAKAGELSGREIAADDATRRPGVCTHNIHPEMTQESTCLK